VRDQLHWLLAALVLWLALDGWSPRAEMPQQQASS
jgi:5'-3' exonuclease